MNLYIPKYFTLEELTRSDYRYSRNIPNFEQIENLSLLCKNVLDPLRDILQSSLHINSAFRNKEVNRLVGGVSNSFHLYGCAADIVSPIVKPSVVYGLIQDQLPFTELGLYHNFVHVAYDKDNIAFKTFKKI